jgi:hypothetical protein
MRQVRSIQMRYANYEFMDSGMAGQYAFAIAPDRFSRSGPLTAYSDAVIQFSTGRRIGESRIPE